MFDKIIHHRWTRALVVTASILAMELVRQTVYVHALLYDQLRDAGVEEFPENLFEFSGMMTAAGNAWLIATAACFLVIADLCREVWGKSWSSILRATTLAWAATFGISWLSFALCGLVQADLVAAALAGAWLESLLIVGIAMRWPVAGAP